MPRILSVSLIWVSLLLIFENTVSARHVHRNRIHRHHGRQIWTPSLVPSAPTFTTSESSPSATGGNAVLADIQNIQKGLTDLPQDIFRLITELELRLSEIESILASLLPTTAATSLPSSLGTPNQALPTPNSLVPLSPIATAAATPPSPSLCRPEGAGPLVPCRTSGHAHTRTSSRHMTTTQVSHTSNNQTSLLYGSGTTPTLLSTAVYSTQNSSAIAVTVSVNHAPDPASNIASTYSHNPMPSPYTFQPDSQDNVAVYYGTTPATQPGGLIALCESQDVDIAILSFLFDFFGPQGYPSVDFGPGCSAPNIAQSQQAPGLKDCTVLAHEIAGCQQLGKKVLVSLGGYIANTSLESDNQAIQLGETLWNLFGAGSGGNPDLRPFGTDVVIDGFDIDNENHHTDYYETFATALCQKFASDPSKTYYLSAAPQCPMPDESIPVGAMAQADFVWVQFYNNPQCNLDSAGFQSSFAAWSASLNPGNTSTSGKPRLYIGAGAFEGAGSGYVRGSGLSTVVSLARELYVDNLGGIMLWDGPEGAANVDQYGVNYLSYAKAALH